MQKNGKMMKCLFCGKSIYIPKARQKSFKYCSHSCHGKAVLRNEEVVKKIKRKYGENHPNWKGGSITSHGYKVISINGKQMYEHRFVMEEHLGRKLRRKECIHHINHNKLDNRIENLLLCKSASEHTIIAGHTPKLKIPRDASKTCKHCGKKFFRGRTETTKFINKKFCTHNCFCKYNHEYFKTKRKRMLLSYR